MRAAIGEQGYGQRYHCMLFSCVVEESERERETNVVDSLQADANKKGNKVACLCQISFALFLLFVHSNWVRVCFLYLFSANARRR